MVVRFILLCALSIVPCILLGQDRVNVLVLKDKKTTRMVCFYSDRLCFVGLADEGGEGFVRRDGEIKNIHIIVNNASGRITITYIACLFGVSFAMWSDGSPIELKRIPIGIEMDRKKNGFFARFSIDSIDEMPKDVDSLRKFGVEDVREILNKAHKGDTLP